MPLLETITFQQSSTNPDATVTYADTVKTQAVEMTINVKTTETDELDSGTEMVQVKTSWTNGIKTAYEDSDFFMFRSRRFRIVNRQRLSNRLVYWTGERVN